MGCKRPRVRSLSSSGAYDFVLTYIKALKISAAFKKTTLELYRVSKIVGRHVKRLWVDFSSVFDHDFINQTSNSGRTFASKMN